MYSRQTEEKKKTNKNMSIHMHGILFVLFEKCITAALVIYIRYSKRFTYMRWCWMTRKMIFPRLI